MTGADGTPIVEDPSPLDPEDTADVAPRDNEVDFDDESDDDQLPVDRVEASEVGVLLDDPEQPSSQRDG